MTTPGPSSRFLYVFDGTANLGVNLTGTLGQVGEFHPPAIEETLQELTGSAAAYPTIQRVGHSLSPDMTIPLWADSGLQGLIDDLMGTTAADRSDLRIIVTGINSDVIAQKATMARGYLQRVEPKTPPAALTQVDATVKFTGVAHVGDILHELSAETADGDTEADSIDGTAQSATGGYGYWGYTTYTADGATGVVVRVIDSADDITFGALITFTTVTATTGGGQYSPLGLTDTVERYVACDWDFTGTPGAGTTCTFYVGFQRGQ
ncbi:MAG: hypothetical protein IPK80_02925 [Nannocystis sp.]|nr:hypothetical protein [Nannocystis sp.]